MNEAHFPLEPTAAAAQAAIAEEFGYFADWAERYQYLIDLGRKLPEFPESLKTEEHRLLGCQSMVWIVAEGDAGRLDFRAISDSAIVSGLIFLALRVYSGRGADEILATEPGYIDAIGLAKHLSPTRNNGLAALLDFIRQRARSRSGLMDRADPNSETGGYCGALRCWNLEEKRLSANYAKDAKEAENKSGSLASFA